MLATSVGGRKTTAAIEKILMIYAELLAENGASPRALDTHERTFTEKTSEGASPRARGNPEVVAPRSVMKGRIPACAGEPSRRRRP